MLEMLKNKTTIVLIVFILAVALIGGLETKNDAEQVDTNYIANDLQK